MRIQKKWKEKQREQWEILERTKKKWFLLHKECSKGISVPLALYEMQMLPKTIMYERRRRINQYYRDYHLNFKFYKDPGMSIVNNGPLDFVVRKGCSQNADSYFKKWGRDESTTIKHAFRVQPSSNYSFRMVNFQTDNE